MTDRLELSARLGAMTNLVHGFIYFAPEATEEYSALGLPPEAHYFASRAAALGPVPGEVVTATFFNFHPSLAPAVIPAAWDIAAPADIQRARIRAAGRVLARDAAGVPAEDLAEATDVLGRMIDGVGDAGRPLAAGNRATPEPDEPWQRFWQRVTTVREWRGDAHVAALVAAPVDPVEALILHAATGVVPRSALAGTRRWSDDDWEAGIARLAARGLVDDDGEFTDAGRAFREEIEHRTDVASLPLVEAVGVEDTRRLLELMKPVRRALLDAGAFAMMGR